MQEKIVGILGGMGPEATVDLMQRVIKSTPAADDIDHIRMVVDNNPKVPSRIKALIEKNGENPTRYLREMACKLEAWGVDFLAMPCNTAHYYHKEIQSVLQIPLLNMIDLTVNTVVSNNPGLETVGIIASTAVLDLELYRHQFSKKDVRLLVPDVEHQQEIMSAIRSIKTSKYNQQVTGKIQAAADNLVQKGAEVLLIACTEVSVIAQQLELKTSCYDSAQVLAESIVSKAKSI